LRAELGPLGFRPTDALSLGLLGLSIGFALLVGWISQLRGA
jgi:hypothetical protein